MLPVLEPPFLFKVTLNKTNHMKHANYAVLDCETGGLDCKEHQITQIAIVVLHHTTLEEIARWNTYIKPYGGLSVSQIALDKTTVTREDIAKGMDVKDVCKRIKDIMYMKEVRAQKSGQWAHFHMPQIVGHNVSFDIAFIKEAFIHAGMPNTFNEIFSNNNGECNYLDTQKMAKLKWDGNWPPNDNRSLQLGVCCERMGIKLIGAHGAVEDTQATAELFRAFSKEFRGSEKQEKGSKTGKVTTSKSLTTKPKARHTGFEF